MSYNKYTWQTGETITADKMNHIEDGIASAGGGSGSDSLIRFDASNSTSGEVTCNLSLTDLLNTFADFDKVIDNSNIPIILAINNWSALRCTKIDYSVGMGGITLRFYFVPADSNYRSIRVTASNSGGLVLEAIQ